MRIFLFALLVALTGVVVAMPQTRAQDAFDFGDPLPVPPPPIDDSPAPPSTAATPAAPALDAPPAPAAATPTPAALPPAVTVASDTPAPLPLPPSPVDSGTTPGAAPAIVPAVASLDPVFTGPETPKAAKISGGRVNVRAGPNTQYESIAVLTTGTPVTVLSKHGEWYKIVFPADQLASIHRNFVTAEITGEIPETGVPGVVNQDSVDVHAYYWDKSTVVGKVNKGDPVVIRQERGQWFRISAPPTTRAYVFAEYVRVDGGTADIPVDTTPPPENPAVDLTAGKEDPTGRPKLSKADQDALAKKEAYFKYIRDQARLEEERAEQQVSELQTAIDDLEARLRAVDDQTSGMYSYSTQTTTVGSAEWAPPDPLYGGYTGWIENIGRVGGAPASYRLSKGGEVRFYLRSDKFNLDEFVNRRVWVNGNVELAAGASANLLNVDQVRVLTDIEINEGAGGVVPQPAGTAAYGDPYSAPAASDPYAAYGYEAATGAVVQDPTTTWNVTPSSPSELPDYVGGSVYAAPPAAVYAQPIEGGATTTYADPYMAQPYVDPYAQQPTYSQPYDAGQPSAYTPPPGSGMYPAPMSQPSLGPGLYSTTPGEVGSDYYESPFVSEVGP